jgi:hypothetical protein
MGQEMRGWRGAIPLLGLVVLLCGCETRSISNSGYVANGSGYIANGGRGNPFYAGELTEFDLLGIDVSRPATEAEIADQLAKRQKVGVRKGASMMVIQSGALIPDDQMMKELDRYFSVVPFTGVPLVERERPSYASSSPSPILQDERITNYAKALRLAAAKSGAEVIFCYWGMIESAVEREPTKAISWVPLIGAAVPDEMQLMRIRLKVAVIDVRSGQWSMFAPEAYVDSALSASLIRAQSDQHQVAALKEKVYKAAVEAFVAKYTS